MRIENNISDGSVLEFFSLFDAVDIGIIVINQSFEISLWNNWLERYSFLESEDVLAKKLNHVFTDLPNRITSAIEDALTHGMSGYLSAQLNKHPLALFSSKSKQQNNIRIHQKISLRPFKILNEHMCVIQISDVSIDFLRVTSLREKTAQLQYAIENSKGKKDELKAIIDNSLDTILRLNQDGRIINFYNSATKMFGYQESDVLGKPFSILLPSPYNNEFDRLFIAGVKTQSITVDSKVKALRSDGSIFHCELSLNPLLNNGETQFILTIKDTTERVLVQDALYHAKEQAQVTLNSIDDGVISTDIIGRIKYLNPAGEKLIGKRFNTVKDKVINQVLTVHSANKELPAISCIRTGLKVESTEGDELVASDGTLLVIHQVASPIHNVVGDVIGSVLIFRDVSHSHRLASRLSWQASHDELTQLINRREFERQLENIIESARNEGAVHSLCFMDLDKFKAVNDTCGHAAGDELLKQLSEIFRSRVRGADQLARLGGDEFGIILTKCALEPAIKLAEQIRQAVEEYRFVWEGRSFQVGVSIGVLTVDATTDDMENVFIAADSACYAAKEAGRNRVHVYSPDDEEIAQRQGEAQWLEQLQSALDDDRFELHYQPIVPIQDENAVIHYEILIRMIDSRGQSIPPGAFIPSAERYQMMSKVDRWVIKNTFDWMNKYWDVNHKEVFAINLSGQSIADTSFLNDVKNWLNDCQFPPSSISFEITETAAISNLKLAQQFIHDFKDIGCGFALDDFGSGLSSFAYLKNMPVDYLKIDGVFVRDIAEDPIDKAMVEAIHNVGAVLNLKTIAEFVEDGEILSVLKGIGVNYAQGYGIDHPKPLPKAKVSLYKAK